MRVVAVIDSLARGGTEQSVADLLPAVLDLGVETSIVQLVDRDGFTPALEARGVHVHTLDSSDRRARIGELRRLLASVRPDVVHTQLFEADIVGRLSAASLRIPVVSSLVNTSYGSEHLHSPGLRSSRVRLAQAADVATAMFVRRFHAVSEPVKSTMAGRLLVQRSRIDVIPRGRDAVRLGRADPVRRRNVRHELGLGDDVPVILAIGRHEWQKGFDVLLDALPLLRHPIAGIVLIAGRDGSHTVAIDQKVRSLDVRGWQCRLLGVRDDVGDLLAAADLLAFPSRWEGLPGTLIEALALETPIVASDIAPVREVVAGLPGVRLVPPDDPGALAKTISTFLSEPADVSGHRQRFDERYELQTVAGQMAAFYRQALRP